MHQQKGSPKFGFVDCWTLICVNCLLESFGPLYLCLMLGNFGCLDVWDFVFVNVLFWELLILFILGTLELWSFEALDG